VKYVGQPIRRVNDHKLVTGYGRFVDDIQAVGTLHIGFVRSPYAHADISGIDVRAACDLPGVAEVIDGATVHQWMKPIVSHEALLPGRHLERYPLAVDRARFAGDAVAAVLADSAALARDAADLVEVDFHELPAVTSSRAALEPDAPRVYPDWDSNVAWHWSAESGDIEAAFAAAAHRVTSETIVQRVASVFIEPRAILTVYDPRLEEMTVWASTQVPHTLRTGIATMLDFPEHSIRVIAPDVGGGFGSKGGLYPEYLFAAAASFRLGRPVKWIETRSEHFRATNHGRDQVQELEAAVSADGRITGLRVRVYSNCGAYNAASVGQRTGIMSTGPYLIPTLRTDVYGVMTNTTQTGAYRGAGRPEAAYMLERLIEHVATTTGIDAVEVRRRNFIPPDAFPYRGASGALYDSGNYAGALDKALDLLDWPAERERQARARAAGRLVGIGVGVYCEFAGPGWDSAEVRVHPSGAVTVFTGISPHGQGNETSLAQIVADDLGIPMDAITVKASDTAVTPQGIGTFGSRGTAIGGGAVVLASAKVRDKVKQLAAAMLEVAPEDIDLADAHARVVGAPDRALPFTRISRAAHQMDGIPGGLEPGLDAQAFFKPDGRQFPFGVHLAVVEVDRDTGEVAVRRYVAVDDCGTIINPLLVEGQVHGGLAQGFGQALYEEIVYDESGQLLSGSLMDYAAPRAEQLPWFELDATVTPSPFTPHGAKGVGEAGTTGAPPALVNAVLDALRPIGVTHLDMPLKPEKIWRAIQNHS
jgi:carbon-monoxide dehydrogenase large subunit